MSELGLTLRRLRMLAGVTVPKAALAAGVPTSYINRLEAGKEPLGYVEALKLIKAYASCASCFRRYVDDALVRDGIARHDEEETEAIAKASPTIESDPPETSSFDDPDETDEGARRE